METVAQPPDAELHLLTNWSEPGEGARHRTAAIGSLIAHAVLIVVAILTPTWAPPPRELVVERRITPLVEPITELTQKAPNTEKPSKEFNAHEATPRPRIQIPQGAMSTTRPAAPRPAPPIPPMPAPKGVTPQPEPEAPKVEARVAPPPKIEVPTLQAPPPQIQAEEKKPKSMFEDVAPAAKGAATGRSEVPLQTGSVVADAVRQAVRSGPAGGLTVGDSGVGSGGLGTGANLPPAAGARRSDIQLLSDPLGVDFRAYLTQILVSVKRNWLAVMPESVGMGRRGQVAIQFSIARDGKVPKLVIATSSGQDPLDRAAVAGISASSPFPALPNEFKGDRIVVQFNFSYNMPRP
jgi:TonB family protein